MSEDIMITDFELLDLSAVFKLLRFDSAEKDSVLILDKVISVLNEDSSLFEDNQIRIALASIPGLNKEKWGFVYHNNIYVTHRLLKNKAIYSILIKSCMLLKAAFTQDELDKANDLLDCIHCLPEIIVDNQLHITKSYWKTYVSIYRKKWDMSFLQDEEKEYRRSVKAGYK